MARGESRLWSRRLLIKCLLMLLPLLSLGWRASQGLGTFGFDIHHRFSDPVRGVLDADDWELPEKGSVVYYAVMAHRDRAIHGRRLADNHVAPLTFSTGNETYRLNSLGFLHYANVTVGTPGSWFLVALDTGSDLFWLPCDCSSCVLALRSSSGQRLSLDIYSPSTSSTSYIVPCNSTLCTAQAQCHSSPGSCPYKVIYLSNGTSSTGVLVDDVLHLITDDDQTKAVDARITFGCGQVEAGSFLNGAALNGLLGLGIRNISVPSRLAKEGLAANSFSMCFRVDGIGRISFGDKGSINQGETPFNLQQPHPTYNVTVSQITIGGSTKIIEFTAIFDSGTSFTYLKDPAYTLISETFDSLVQDTRLSSDLNLPFEYCYVLSSTQTSYTYPTMNLTMKGGDQFSVNDPTGLAHTEDGSHIYCLTLVKSRDVNIIGQNFMTGYRIVFDREKMVLGWEASDCYKETNSSMLNIPRTRAAAVPPTAIVNPQATSGGGNRTRSLPNASNYLLVLNYYTFITLILFSFLATTWSSFFLLPCSSHSCNIQ